MAIVVNGWVRSRKKTVSQLGATRVLSKPVPIMSFVVPYISLSVSSSRPQFTSLRRCSITWHARDRSLCTLSAHDIASVPAQIEVSRTRVQRWLETPAFTHSPLRRWWWCRQADIWRQDVSQQFATTQFQDGVYRHRRSGGRWWWVVPVVYESMAVRCQAAGEIGI